MAGASVRKGIIMPKEDNAAGKRPWYKSGRSVALVVLGILLILAAVRLWIWALLWLPGFEAWLMLAVLITAPLGVFVLVEGLLEPGPSADEVRRLGKGKDTPHDPQRKDWVEAQSRRSYQITAVAVTVMVVALALYVGNHVTGRLDGTGEDGIRWQTHEERLEAGSVYITEEGEMLASIAVSQGISLKELAEENPDVQLEFTGVMTSTLDPTVTLGVPDDRTTIKLQKAAQERGISASELAEGFSAATLSKDWKMRIPKQPVVDYRQWFDWVFWALIGVAAYLLIEDARHYREIPEGEGDFLGETLWYWAQFFTGPLIAFVVLLVFTRIDLKLLGKENGAAIAVDTSQFVPDLLFVPAFLLGFYSRVARHVLDDIMKSIFRSAWLAAHGEFEIVSDDLPPEDNVVESKKAVVFKTQPATEVTWLTSRGNIEATGAYTAPEVTDAPQDVIITAVAGRGAAMASKVITVVPHKFKVITVNGAELEVTPGGKLKLTIVPLPEEEAEQQKIAWKITSKTKPETEIEPQGKETTLAVSDQESPETSITVAATYKGHSESITLKVVEGAAAPPLPTPKLEKIEAKVDDTPVSEGGTLAPGSHVTFTVIHTLGEDKVQEIKWSTTAGATDFTLPADAKGEFVVGEVPAGATADAQITVTATYGDLEPVSFTFKVAAS